jgi:Predicted transcriptional regulator
MARFNISNAEWEVMRVVWRKPSITAQQVIDDLQTNRSWSASTIKTLLNRLVKKQVLKFEKNGRQYVYAPLVSEEECRTSEIKSFLDRVFDGTLSPMLAHYVRNEPLAEQEIEELERILKQRTL